MVRKYDAPIRVEWELDGDDLDELGKFDVKVLMLDKEGDKFCLGGSFGNSRESELPPVMDGRLKLPLETGRRRGVPSLLSAWCRQPLSQSPSSTKFLSLSTKVSVKECEIDCPRWGVIALAPAVDVGDTCLRECRCAEDLTKAMGEVISEREGALDMEQTLANQLERL